MFQIKTFLLTAKVDRRWKLKIIKYNKMHRA